MQVKRIVANIFTADPKGAALFYGEILGLNKSMDMGWIITYEAATEMNVQITFASEGGSGTVLPAISIEVDDVGLAFKKMKTAGFIIEYPLTDEPWGVRRFFVLDPFGKLVNILQHI